nr:hydantoinase/oxoprolinase family protein [Amycolatopsis pithecellobii]
MCLTSEFSGPLPLRNATTIMSTQIGPGLRDYLSTLENELREYRLAGPLLVLGHRNIISTDVGGTTFLVVDGEPVRDTITVINHHPINVPTLRVDAIGSGGGAIAWLDPGRNLHIGPRSAQAVPGPACYGNGGTEPTNTDANLVLGILPERGLLGGPQATVARAGPPGDRNPDRQATGHVGGGGRRGDLHRPKCTDR